MRPIAPRTGAPEETLAEDGGEWFAVTVAVYAREGGGTVVLTRWTLTPEERAAVAAGEDIYASVVTFDGDVPPFHVRVGPGTVGDGGYGMPDEG